MRGLKLKIFSVITMTIFSLGCFLLFSRRSNAIPNNHIDQIEKNARLELDLMEALEENKKLTRNLASCLLSMEQSIKDINELEERFFQQEKVVNKLNKLNEELEAKISEFEGKYKLNNQQSIRNSTNSSSPVVSMIDVDDSNRKWIKI